MLNVLKEREAAIRSTKKEQEKCHAILKALKLYNGYVASRTQGFPFSALLFFAVAIQLLSPGVLFGWALAEQVEGRTYRSVPASPQRALHWSEDENNGAGLL